MGTKGSYSGSAAGGDLRDGLDDWLASLPGADGQAPPPPGNQPSLLSPLKPSPSSPGPGAHPCWSPKGCTGCCNNPPRWNATGAS